VTIARDPRIGEWRNDEFSYQPNAINPQDDLSRHRFQETNRPYQRVCASDALNCGGELIQVDASTFSAADIDIGFAFLRDILCAETASEIGLLTQKSGGNPASTSACLAAAVGVPA
jgi:hypothetical protein